MCGGYGRVVVMVHVGRHAKVVAVIEEVDAIEGHRASWVSQ